MTRRGMNTGRKVSIDQVRTLHAGGVTTPAALAAALGVHYRTAMRWLDVVDPRRERRASRTVTQAQVDRILVLARDGLPTGWIAEDAKVALNTVNSVRTKAGIEGPGPKERVWPQVRWKPELAALHREFAPSDSCHVV